MNWLPPFIVHGAHEIAEAELAAHAARLRERLQAWLAAHDERAGGFAMMRDALIYLAAAVLCVPLAKRLAASARSSDT
jgi:hypothetical protein